MKKFWPLMALYTWSTGILNGVRSASSPRDLVRFRADLLLTLTTLLGVFLEGPSCAFCFSDLPLAWGAVGRNLGDILNLNALLGVGEDVSRLGDLILYKMLVE